MDEGVCNLDSAAVFAEVRRRGDAAFLCRLAAAVKRFDLKDGTEI
jgi:hypothetical protein